jgi:cyclophilin family peptidyl-prolyl cis-trans isomerase
MKNIFFSLLVLSAVFPLMAQNKNSATPKNQKQKMVIIETPYGNIKVKLYNETPLHRDNFIKLVKEKKYDASIFHRVIKNFMVQGGGLNGGMSDIGDQIPAEIVKGFFHKKGALCAARQGDQVNPQKKSSGSQFYIVQGQVFTQEQLQMFTSRMGKTFTEEQIKIYTTLGGTPHLDNDYTVFGEVVEGLDVVDKIAAVETQPGDRPKTDVWMKMKMAE